MIKETDLSEPIKSYFKQKGYQVQAEVKNCDIIASKNDELIVVELKTSANMTLLIQATARQSISKHVYLAIPEPAKRKGTHWKGIVRVVSALDLGLLVVNFNNGINQPVTLLMISVWVNRLYKVWQVIDLIKWLLAEKLMMLY